MEKLIVKSGIAGKIYLVRGLKVMLDRDLAELYGVETRVFNQAVKRNIDRFPKEFCFQLTKKEFENLRSQTVTSSEVANLKSQNATSSLRSQSVTLKTDRRGQHRKYLPYVFDTTGAPRMCWKAQK